MQLYFFLYYPIGVEADGHKQPWLSWALMALMVGIFTYFQLHPIQRLLTWGWWIFYPRDGLTPGLLLSTFNHANWVHLCGNLIYIWALAPSLETALGRRRFLLVFVFLGLSASLIQAALAETWMTHLAGLGILGASGAISGMLGLFLVRFPYARIRTAWLIVSPLHGKMKSGILAVPVLLATFVWLAFQFLAISNRLLGIGGDTTAYGAHLGGWLCGILLAFGFGYHLEGRLHGWRRRARRRFARGEWLGAYEAALPLLESNHPEDSTLAARASRLIGHNRESMELYQRAVQDTLALGDEVGAAVIYTEAFRFFPNLHFVEPLHYRLVLALDKLGHESATLTAIHAYRSLYFGSERYELLLLRGARLEGGMDPDAAREYYREHVRRFPDSPFTGMVRSALRQLGPA